MDDKFDILEYMSGLTGYVFDKAVLKSIAMERGVFGVTVFEDLDSQTKDLLRADLLYTAYLSPNVMASSTHQHGSFSQSVGSQSIYPEEKEKIYNTFVKIYRKYEDDKIQEIEGGGNLQWLSFE